MIGKGAAGRFSTNAPFEGLEPCRDKRPHVIAYEQRGLRWNVTVSRDDFACVRRLAKLCATLGGVTAGCVLKVRNRIVIQPLCPDLPPASRSHRLAGLAHRSGISGQHGTGSELGIGPDWEITSDGWEGYQESDENRNQAAHKNLRLKSPSI
jgi:hypothetical protein